MNKPTCPSCGGTAAVDVKQEFLERYSYMVDTDNTLLGILFRADCASSGLPSELISRVHFCPFIDVRDYGYYTLRRWWVWYDDLLERWDVGPGGFFRHPTDQCGATLKDHR